MEDNDGRKKCFNFFYLPQNFQAKLKAVLDNKDASF